MAAPTPICPRCDAGYSAGDDACANCGRLLEGVQPGPVSVAQFPPLDPHGPAPATRYELVAADELLPLVRGDRAGMVALRAEPLLIGRRVPSQGHYPEVDVTGLPGADFVSRSQASVAVADGAVVVTDLSGHPTTVVNERPVPANTSVELRAGDRLILGEQITFVLHEVSD